MKPITRIDIIDPDLLEKAQAKEATRQKEAEEYRAQIAYEASPEGIEAKRVREEQEKIKMIKFRREMDKEYNERYSKDRRGNFNYFEKVIVTNPLPDGHGCSEAHEHLNRRGRIRSKNNCLCIHAGRSENCYYVYLYGDSRGIHHHFEESELSRA